MSTSISKKSFPVKAVVQTSLFTALAIVVRNLSYMVYFGGAPGMRIGFSGIFTKIAAILSGPFLGGAASGILDIMGYLIKPEGAYIPLLTVSAILGGVVTGVLWKVFGKTDTDRLQRAALILISAIGAAGIFNHICISYYSKSLWARTIQGLGKYRDFASIGLEAIAIVGIILFIADFAVKKKIKKPEMHNDFLKVLLVTGISGVLVTTLNTYILQLFIPQLGKMGFVIFWIPRVIQEIFMTVIQAYIVSLLLSIYKKTVTK